MSNNQATFTAIFEASNQIEVVRACLRSDIEVPPDKAMENDGMSIILANVIESLAKHVETLMDEDAEQSAKAKTKLENN